LEKILSDKWTLESNDKDMIVMYNNFGYEVDGAKNKSILNGLYWEDQTSPWQNSWFTGGNGDLTYLKWENHYPGLTSYS
jgi:hypothetical protein